jgi:hypothetical protein
MVGAAFENALGGIFARCDQAIAERLDKAKARAEALQSQDTSRLAFTLTEAIEHEIEPAIDLALATYDAAINRPLKPDRRWEEAVRRRIEHAVDAGVGLAMKLDAERHPWKPLLTAETPKLRDRLIARADRHFDALGKRRKSGRGRMGETPEILVRFGVFGAGVLVGALAMYLAAGR